MEFAEYLDASLVQGRLVLGTLEDFNDLLVQRFQLFGIGQHYLLRRGSTRSEAEFQFWNKFGVA